MNSPAVQVDDIVKSFDGGTNRVLDGVDLIVDDGSFTCILGTSGGGKSTLLGCIAGLVEPDAGRLAVGGNSVLGMAAHRRPVTMVLQSPRLFPFMSIADNVAFGLRTRRVKQGARRRRAGELLDLVGLDLDPDRGVDGLSGGEQQRVALARALAVDPDVLLLDEPLASLDPPTRRVMQRLLADVHRAAGTTMVLVTHDREEALTLADHLVVLDAGRVDADGRPADLFERPPSVVSARLLGAVNIFDGALIGQAPGLGTVRPEHIGLEDSAVHGLNGVVTSTIYRGERTDVAIAIAGVELVASVPSADAPTAGTNVGLDIGPDRWVRFPD